MVSVLVPGLPVTVTPPEPTIFILLAVGPTPPPLFPVMVLTLSDDEPPPPNEDTCDILTPKGYFWFHHI